MAFNLLSCLNQLRKGSFCFPKFKFHHFIMIIIINITIRIIFITSHYSWRKVIRLQTKLEITRCFSIYVPVNIDFACGIIGCYDSHKLKAIYSKQSLYQEILICAQHRSVLSVWRQKDFLSTSQSWYEIAGKIINK